MDSLIASINASETTSPVCSSGSFINVRIPREPKVEYKWLVKFCRVSWRWKLKKTSQKVRDEAGAEADCFGELVGLEYETEENGFGEVVEAIAENTTGPIIVK